MREFRQGRWFAVSVLIDDAAELAQDERIFCEPGPGELFDWATETLKPGEICSAQFLNDLSASHCMLWCEVERAAFRFSEKRRYAFSER